MDSQWEALFQYGCSVPDHPYLPNISKPVHILGNIYDAKADRDSIEAYLKSKLWMTYRKEFSSIGGVNGPNSDTGWGCMHRCGQMILAEALSQIHLGKGWLWSQNTNTADYHRLLRMFQDRKSALYSIQTIALTGVSVGKPVGSWLGPNTVAQIIKKLSIHDHWTNLVVHIAVEDGVIVDEIKSLCRQSKCATNSLNRSIEGGYQVVTAQPSSTAHLQPDGDSEDKVDNSSDGEYDSPFVQKIHTTDTSDESPASDTWNKEAILLKAQADDAELVDIQSLIQFPVIRELDDDCVEIVHPPKFTTSNPDEDANYEMITTTNTPTGEASSTTIGQSDVITPSGATGNAGSPLHWRPLLLFVSIRLGVHTPNPYMLDALKSVFHLPQCVGVLGGRPAHAVWIVGYAGDHVICLDPHSTQPAFRSANITPEWDNQFHCDTPTRIPLAKLDPSMVIGFLCLSEMEFDALCGKLRTDLLYKTKGGAKLWPLIECHPTRLSTLPPLPTTSAAIDRTSNVSTLEGGLADLIGESNGPVEDTVCEEGADDDDDDDHSGQDSKANKLRVAVNGMCKLLLSKYQRLAGQTVRQLLYDTTEEEQQQQQMDDDDV